MSSVPPKNTRYENNLQIRFLQGCSRTGTGFHFHKDFLVSYTLNNFLLQFCGICLYNRYGENAKEALLDDVCGSVKIGLFL